MDEAFTWASAGIRGPFALTDLLENLHGPLFSLILHLWGAVAGDSEWALRAPSALFGIALVPAIAWLADRWLGRPAAFAAAWLAALSPFLVWYSQESRNYALLMLAACLSGAWLLALRRRPRASGVVGYLVAAGAGLLSNLSFAFVAPLHLRWALGAEGGSPDPARRARRRWATLGGALALALLVLPWTPQAVRVWDWQRLHPGRTATQPQPPLRGHTTFHAAAVPFALHAFAVGYTLGPSLRELRADASLETLRRHAPELAAVGLVFGTLGLLGLRALARRKCLLDALVWLAAPAVVVSWFALSNFKVFHPRYLAVSFPAFVLVLAAAFADLKPRARAAFGAAVALLWTVSLGHHYFDPRYGKEDMRAAAALIAKAGAPGEKVLAVNTQNPLFYYYRGPLPVTPFWLGFARDPARLDLELDRALAGSGGAWVVLSRPEDLDPAGAFGRRLEARYPDAERHAFEGVRVWHLKASVVGRSAAPPAA